MDGADGHHDGIGAVIVQMMVHAGTADTAQIGEEHAGEVGVILFQNSGYLPVEIQNFDDSEKEHQEPPGRNFQNIHGSVGTAALLRPGLMNLPHHLPGHGGQRPVLRRGGHNQLLLAVILKALLRHKAEGDLMALVIPPSGDIAVQIRPQIDRFGNGHEDAVEQRSLIFLFPSVLFLYVPQNLRHVELHIHIDLGIGTLVHQVGHDDVQAVQLPDPAGICPVPPPFFLFFHNSLLI